MPGDLTHFDEHGKARMVDVGDKPVTRRVATASGSVLMAPGTLERIKAGTIEKGDVLGIARLAGIMAAKQTANLIPLCHPLPLTSVTLSLQPQGNGRLRVEATCQTDAKTGVEMEALTAVSVACLTVYDMVKAIDREMRIADIQLDEKSGGRSGTFVRS